VQVALGLLRRRKIVELDEHRQVRLLQRGLAPDALRSLMNDYRDKRDQDRETLERMVFYAQTGQCRWRLLLEHLEGEATFERCRHCDNCVRIARQEQVQAQEPAPAPAEQPAPASRSEPAFERGELVQVKRYGRGEVRSASAVEVTVAFADGSVRSFQPEFVSKAKVQRARQAVAA
jgi:ATP-dependent DNA helicase RecQ